jgi:uncharacterized damage-inducible protein DinB
MGAVPTLEISLTLTPPRAALPFFQHVLDTYASETNKTAAVFRSFSAAEPSFRPHARSMTVLEVMRHQLLSERRFFADFLDSSEPLSADALPATETVETMVDALLTLAAPRLDFLVGRNEGWWLEPVRFFDVGRERIWVFWRRVLHSAHHRTQLTVYLRLLDKPVVSVYGPTADVTWTGADPTVR